MVATKLSMQAMLALSAKYWFYITLAYMTCGSRGLRMLNQSVTFCCQGSNLIISQRCDSVLGIIMSVFGNWLWRIYDYYYFTRTWVLIKQPFCLLYFILIYVVDIASKFCFYCSWHELEYEILCIAILSFYSTSCKLPALNKV